MKSVKSSIFWSLATLLALCSCSVHSQEINFKDLNRSGPPVVKRFIVEGTANDGVEYLKKFDGVDADRINEARRRAASYSSSSSSSGSGNWTCKFQCLAPLYTGTWHEYSLRASASDQDKAWDAVEKQANKICQADKPGNGQWASKKGLCKSD